MAIICPHEHVIILRPPKTGGTSAFHALQQQLGGVWCGADAYENGNWVDANGLTRGALAAFNSQRNRITPEIWKELFPGKDMPLYFHDMHAMRQHLEPFLSCLDPLSSDEVWQFYLMVRNPVTRFISSVAYIKTKLYNQLEAHPTSLWHKDFEYICDHIIERLEENKADINSPNSPGAWVSKWYDWIWNDASFKQTFGSIWMAQHVFDHSRKSVSSHVQPIEFNTIENDLRRIFQRDDLKLPHMQKTDYSKFDKPQLRRGQYLKVLDIYHKDVELYYATTSD